MWLERLAEMKKESGKTIRQISSESGIPLGTLNKLFAGQTKDPKLGTLRAVVHVLGHTIDDLLPAQNQEEEPLDVKDELFEVLRGNYELLNREGRERLVEASDDMVQSGKYIKSYAADLGREA